MSQTDSTSDLTARELKLLRCIGKSLIGLDEISHRMGYRPARSGRLAVKKTLMSMAHRHGFTNGAYGMDSKYVVRLPPRDQWDHEKWALTSEGKHRVSRVASEDDDRQPPRPPGM